MNDEVDVVVVGITGDFSLWVDGREYELGAGDVAHVPKGLGRPDRSAKR